MAAEYFITCMNHSLFNHLSINKHLVCFGFFLFSIIISAALNISLHISYIVRFLFLCNRNLDRSEQDPKHLQLFAHNFQKSLYKEIGVLFKKCKLWLTHLLPPMILRWNPRLSTFKQTSSVSLKQTFLEPHFRKHFKS